MKAAIYRGIKTMACEERPAPTVTNEGDAIVRVVRSCVCGSDLWFFRDGREADTQTGHEAIGVVEEVGGGVNVARPGDFVIVPFPYSCGECPVCKAGFESSCPHGGYFGSEPGMGCQAEVLRVPHANGTLVPVPGDAASFSDELLADLLTLSDVMPTGYHAAVSAEVRPGDTAVVFGDGAVGLCGVLSARIRGAERIIAMSRHEDRAALARQFGATDIVPERGDEAVARIMDMTGGYGADAVLECVGSAQSNDTAMKVARAGAVVGRVGLPHGVEADIPGLFYRNVGLKGGPAPVRHYDTTADLLSLVLNGAIHPGKVFTAEYTLDQIQEAYDAMDQRRVIKALLRVSEV